MTPLRDVAATRPAAWPVWMWLGSMARGALGVQAAGNWPEKVDPPGGTTGRVGFGTEVDEASVPDANPREAFSGSEVVCL